VLTETVEEVEAGALGIEIEQLHPLPNQQQYTSPKVDTAGLPSSQPPSPTIARFSQLLGSPKAGLAPLSDDGKDGHSRDGKEKELSSASFLRQRLKLAVTGSS
jgi:hypothetical protein